MRPRIEVHAAGVKAVLGVRDRTVSRRLYSNSFVVEGQELAFAPVSNSAVPAGTLRRHYGPTDQPAGGRYALVGLGLLWAVVKRRQIGTWLRLRRPQSISPSGSETTWLPAVRPSSWTCSQAQEGCRPKATGRHEA